MHTPSPLPAPARRGAARSTPETVLLLLLRSASSPPQPARRSCLQSTDGKFMPWLAALPALQKNRDKYGRVVGVCSLNGEDLNGWLVEQGLAVAYRWA